MKKAFISGLILISLLACATGDKDNEDERDSASEQADLIRNPIQSDGTIDSSQMAQIVFDEKIYDFGVIGQGDSVQHSFKFTNEGNKPLLIGNVNSSCGCTVADWPEKPIEVGESGIISVNFDPTDRQGRQKKSITVVSNAIPNKSILYLQGMVNKSD